ncbi:predicted protein [Uncinocarpus reesii 1704]|uniref:Mid2 domain-containing protein n=1 Tax=Uncinocarpus reesii (strain UAMH 1704) TaxID=336963 RepID=C4JNX6_UNCRE|nr:uncharacterized protein UREG_04446 [Uncinocarpus reesii 1704]EEP79600.1 predicted protein [Uncinocarpus reesii 1704]
MRADLFWFFVAPSILFASSDARTCYLPTGEIAENDAPCFPQNPESSCCGGSTYVCATNNMCAYYDGSYYIIGSCTDKTWNSPACSSYCYFRDHIHNSVFRCAAYDDTYCCADGPPCNCTTRANTQKILDFLPPYSELVGSSVALNTDVATTTLLTPVGAKRTTSYSTSLESSTSATLTTTGSTASATVGPQVPTEDAMSDTGLKVGLGVGIPLLAIGLVLGALLLRTKRKSQATRHSSNYPEQGDVTMGLASPHSQPEIRHEAPVANGEYYNTAYKPFRTGPVFEAPNELSRDHSPE